MNEYKKLCSSFQNIQKVVCFNAMIGSFLFGCGVHLTPSNRPTITKADNAGATIDGFRDYNTAFAIAGVIRAFNNRYVVGKPLGSSPIAGACDRGGTGVAYGLAAPSPGVIFAQDFVFEFSACQFEDAVNKYNLSLTGSAIVRMTFNDKSERVEETYRSESMKIEGSVFANVNTNISDKCKFNYLHIQDGGNYKGTLCERKFNSPTYSGPEYPSEKDLGKDAAAEISRIKATATTISPPPKPSPELPALPDFSLDFQKWVYRDQMEPGNVSIYLKVSDIKKTKKLEVFSKGIFLGEIPIDRFSREALSYSWNVTAANNGLNKLTAVATDIAGKKVTASLSEPIRVAILPAPTPITKLGELSWAALSFSSPSSLDVDRDTLVAVDLNGNVLVADVTNSASPIALGAVKCGGNSSKILIKGNYAYIGSTGNYGLSIIDLTKRDKPVCLGNKISGSFDALAVVDNMLYAAGTRDSNSNPSGTYLVAIDVTSKTNPIVKSQLLHKAFGGGVDIQIDGTTLYTAGTSDSWSGPGNGLVSVDISSPASMRILGELNLFNVFALKKIGTSLLVNVREGLIMYDVSNPRNILQTGFVESLGASGKNSIDYINGKLIVLNRGSSIEEVDISNSESFTYLRHRSVAEKASQFVARNNKLFAVSFVGSEIPKKISIYSP
ncbi:MAG: hypothetical protein NTV34_20970 [Proteobacteria bacterium]|nr:hypothetical protein [Pseudomonadota bacterium]